jgi:hypothetical protein
MSSAFQPKKRSALPWILFLGVVAGAIGFGGWLFRSPPTTPPRAPAARVVPANSAEVETAAPAEERVRTEPAGHAELAAALRRKLARSTEDFLQSLAEIGQTQPAAAIDLAQELGRTDEEKSEWVKISMQQWADRDPQSAWQWLRQLSFVRKDELAGGELPALVLGTMAAHDPKSVLSNLDSLLRLGNTSESVSTPVAVHLGVEALVKNGQIDLARQAVEAWAKDPAQLNIEAAAYDTVATAIAKTQPRETGEWLRSLPVSEERNAAISSFVTTWAEQDPRAALQWAEALPPSEGQQAALGRAVSDWIETKPNEVGGWLSDYLSRVPPSASTDTLIERVINVSPTARSSPQTALQWASLISDPAQRTDYEEKIALRWGGRDRAGALDYVQKSPTIPPDRKPALVQQILNSPPGAQPEE